VRSRMAAAVLALGIVAAGCSSSHQAATPGIGVVMGLAQPCIGPPDHGHIPLVTVTAYFTSPGSAKSTVAAKTTANGNNGGSYELQLRPGTYLLSAPESGVGPRTITVTRGQTLIANFSVDCF
jgi:hypothetical protein